MPSARFDDLRAATAYVFGKPERVVVARTADEVVAALEEVVRATRAGAWAWGHLSYEAATAFDPAAQVQPARPGGPLLLCFGVGGPPTREGAITRDHARRAEPVGSWQPEWEPAVHRERVGRVRDAIGQGGAYQVNLTTRLHQQFYGDPIALYARLAHAQGGAYNAYLDLDPAARNVVISASPELFFSWDDRGITARPMKGTARRTDTNTDDDHAAAALRTSEKDRAENVMIVDLLRNDLSRIARTGTVEVTALLEPERYDTVWQLTSTITAQPRPDVDLIDVIAALFPCGSVTGAPKVAAMRLIAELEDSPRGVYCGAVGMIAPPGAPFRARFSVPIRTVALDRRTGDAVYGTGGGITWGSDPTREYDELLAKAAILEQAPPVDFELLETLRFVPGAGLRHLDHHLDRLIDGARYFGFPAEVEQVRRQVHAATKAFPAACDGRVRLLLGPSGGLRVEHDPLDPDDYPDVVGLAVDSRPTATGRWTRHKTTRRDHYAAAAARHPAADDVILVDRDGYALETTRATLAVRLGDHWCTPPLRRGCLPGVERGRLVAAGVLHERDIHSSQLTDRSELAVISSLSGSRPARIGAV